MNCQSTAYTTLDFRIDWGYQYLYSRRHYHPIYKWDGKLTCQDGIIERTFQLDYPLVIFGPGQSAIETELPSPQWHCQTKRGIAGIRFLTRVTEKTRFTLETVMGTITFTAADILHSGRLIFPVGPKYLQCSIIVTQTNHYWFRPNNPDAGITVYNEDSLGLPVHNWARARLAWLYPGESIHMPVTVPETNADYSEVLMQITAMAAPTFSETESYVNTYMPLEILCDGNLVSQFRHYYQSHDIVLQILDDLWKRLRLDPGHHTVSLKNCHDCACLAIRCISFRHLTKQHGQLSLPEWALCGETVHGAVFAACADTLHISGPDMELSLPCKEGWNEFPICVRTGGIAEYYTDTDHASIEILDVQEESVPIKVGYDMTIVPHDDTGEMDWLLEYTHRTRLGNYIVFRSFSGPVGDTLMERWGTYCHEHGIYTSAATDFMNGALVRGSVDHFHDCGPHEFTFPVYAKNPDPEFSTQDMKAASEVFQAFLRQEIDQIHTVSPRAAFGDASGGIRYAYLAGADFVRAETLVGHTMTLLSQARPAAQALGDGTWGVHIAIQHAREPFFETHLGEYFLSLMQPWMMGAEAIYEEDSLFGMWAEERMCWDDLLTKGKRDMTRSFYRFAKTHPRKGTNQRSIAFLEGRYAAPFNGFICDSEQDPHYSVWGAFGCDAPEWGHGQPEKCRQLLDVLMPGASTHPLRQKFDKRRFYFSGTPFGDFDCIPVEAPCAYFQNYRLLLNLGWNTMIEEDHLKLKAFVENGGILLTGLTQFSTHTRRDFLRDMQDLALWQDGDLSELCGIRVHGKSSVYSGQWNCCNRESMTIPALSALPNDSPYEDGEGFLAAVELVDADVVAWDAATGEPMLVRKFCGKGYVYTFTLWAYPGHERFQEFCSAWIHALASTSLPPIHIEDPTGEVFWTIWKTDTETKLMLLNTDWTEKGNIKTVYLNNNGLETPLEVKERTAMIVTITACNTDIETISL